MDELKEALTSKLFGLVDLNSNNSHHACRVLPLLFCAEMYNAPKLYQICSLFVKYNTHDLFHSEVILSLSLPQLKCLLSLHQRVWLQLHGYAQRAGLMNLTAHVDSEAVISQAVQRWVDHTNPTEGEKSMLEECVKSHFHRKKETGEGTSLTSGLSNTCCLQFSGDRQAPYFIKTLAKHPLYWDHRSESSREYIHQLQLPVWVIICM